MKNSSSEVFDNYAAIALEQGLISEAADPKEWRRGSDDISTIEALYGVKPNGDEDILDKAHPESVIIAPSYDRLNGLVENLKERHNIMVGIVNKPHQAKLTQHRYASAHQDLADELIRIGYKMDNRDEDDLRVLADSCSERMYKEAFLPAIPVAVWWGAGALASALGLTYMAQNHNYVSQGVSNDCQKAVVALTALQSESTDIDGILSDTIAAIEYVNTLNEKTSDALSRLPKIMKSNNTLDVAQVASMVSNPHAAYTSKLIGQYRSAVNALVKYIWSTVVPNIKASIPKEELTSDLWARLKKMVAPFSPSVSAKALEALIGSTDLNDPDPARDSGLVKSLSDSVNQLAAKDAAGQAAARNNKSIMEQMQEAVKDSNSMPDEPPAAPKPAAPKSILDQIKDKVKQDDDADSALKNSLRDK